MLITALLERGVPSGKIPLEVETLVSNIGTVSAIGQYFLTSQPLIERVVTVIGPGIRMPANYLVPIGASLSEVLEASGGLTRDTSRILLGGPMMGIPQKSFEVPVTKGTSGLLALGPREVIPLKTRHCIRCGRCLEACPMFLNPSQLNLLARKGLYEEMLEERVMDCMECGSCSFVCPSAIPIVQSIRVAKAIHREKQEAA
jgi:electron transport complex protein RnfC